jgi:hypothetical protein
VVGFTVEASDSRSALQHQLIPKVGSYHFVERLYATQLALPTWWLVEATLVPGCCSDSELRQHAKTLLEAATKVVERHEAGILGCAGDSMSINKLREEIAAINGLIGVAGE